MAGQVLIPSALLLSIATSAQDTKAPAIYFPPPYAYCDENAQATPLPVVNAFENKWFSKYLAAALEPSLYEDAKGPARSASITVRFTWLRSFDPAVVVRVEGLGSMTPRLIAKQLSTAGGIDPGTVSKQLDRPLSSDEAMALEALITQTGVLRPTVTPCDFGMDGAEWLVEGVDKSGYHFTKSWSPRKGPVREFGLATLKLTGWDFKRIY